jgi:hypothetical protein
MLICNDKRFENKVSSQHVDALVLLTPHPWQRTVLYVLLDLLSEIAETNLSMSLGYLQISLNIVLIAQAVTICQ